MSITATSLSQTVVPTTATSSVSAVSSSSTDASGSSDAASSTDMSPMGQLMSQLQSLEQTDPDKAKSVLASIGSTLKSEAGNNSMMSSLADKFTQASQTGDLSALQPPKGGHGGHHHHHGGGGSGSSSASSPTTQATNYDQSSDPMQQIESVISNALQST